MPIYLYTYSPRVCIHVASILRPPLGYSVLMTLPVHHVLTPDTGSVGSCISHSTLTHGYTPMYHYTGVLDTWYLPMDLLSGWTTLQMVSGSRPPSKRCAHGVLVLHVQIDHLDHVLLLYLLLPLYP